MSSLHETCISDISKMNIKRGSYCWVIRYFPWIFRTLYYAPITFLKVMPHCREAKNCKNLFQFQFHFSVDFEKLKKVEGEFLHFLLSHHWLQHFPTFNHRLLMIIQLSKDVFALDRPIHLPTLFLLCTLKKLPFVHHPTSNKSMVNNIFLWYKISFGVKKKQSKKNSTIVIVRRLLLSSMLPTVD